MRVGFHASHEQFAPSELLELVQRAEQSGFEAALCSEHLAPWSERQGESGNAFAWLGAALQATSLPGGLVCAPGPRNHPVVLAHALATLGELYPGRIWAALGTGIALNEAVLERWPAKRERTERLGEGVRILRGLLAGETVDAGGWFPLRGARLYTLPSEPVPLFGAALTPATAAEVGAWADGMITIVLPDDETRAVLAAFREGGGQDKPVFLQAQVSWAPSEDAARSGAHDQWRTNVFDPPVLGDLPSPAHFDAAAAFVRPDDMDEHIRISSDLARHVEWLEHDAELGFDTVFVHNVNRDQRAFLDAFGEHVLPALTGSANRLS